VPSPNRFRVAGRKLAIGAIVTALALGLITAATLFGGGATPTLPSAAPPGWAFAPPMPHRRSYTASAEVGGSIYVAAGMVGNTGRPLNIFERFDPGRNEWISLPFVPESFSAAAGAALDGRMYVIGGNGSSSSKAADGRQVFAYDVARRRWSRKASLPAPRTNLAAVALGGRLYALGGLDPFHATRSVFSYDPARNRWLRAASLPEALHALAAVVFHGEIWVIGGQDAAGKATNRVWVYNPGRNRWRAGPRMPAPMETAGAAVAGDRIYVVLESVSLTYEAHTGRWTRGPRLEVPRHALAVFAVKGTTLYAMGGCVVPQLEDSSVVEKRPLPNRAAGT
jgi:N-acetylneuraminic acid mutarotase